MSLIFVRHGETALNAARVLQPPDTPLNDRGLLQARAVARRLAALRPAAVISSDLPRALQTAEAIAAAADGLPLQTTPMLQERNFGALRGQSYDMLGFDALNQPQAPPGGESTAQFEARVADVLALLLVRQMGLPGPLIVVTHGLVVRAVLKRLPLDAACTLPDRLGNTGVTMVSTATPFTITLANCLQHLDNATLEDGSSLSGG